MTDPRQEELARRLLEEDASKWPGSLPSLRIEKRRLPGDLRSKLDAIAQKPEETKVIRPVWRTRYAGLAAAAVVLVGLTIALGVFFSRSAGQSALAALTFVSGKVRVNDADVKIGQNLENGAKLGVGPRSTAVLAVKHEDLTIEIRIQPDSDVSPTGLSGETVALRIDRGSVLANVMRNPGTDHARGGFTVRTVTAIASVRGTRFAVESEAENSTRLSTFDGTVEFRRRWAILEDLPSDLIDQSDFLSQVRSVFVAASVAVPAGSESFIDGKDFADRTKAITKLEAVLNLPAFSALRGRTDASNSEIRAALRALDEALPNPDERSSLLSAARQSFGRAPGVERVPEEVLEERQSRLEEMTDEERDARYAKLLTGRSDPQAFNRDAEKVLGKKPQEIRLKNGQTIFGFVFGSEGRYKVYTMSGIQTVERADVDEILFR